MPSLATALSAPASVLATEEPSQPGLAAPLILIEGVGKTFRRHGRAVRALSQVNLVVQQGELVCLVGASGCGKSTLLNMVAGILPCTNGTVTVRGARVTGPGRDRGMLFQSPMLFPWLTTQENVLFGPRAQHRNDRTTAELRKDAADVLATVGLAGFEDAYPHELSGGMKHRAAFARALINRPSVLLMDEPFGALDALTRGRMHELLVELWAGEHMTIIFVTHDIEEALMLGDRVCIMGGKPASILEEVPIPLARPRSDDDLEAEQFFACKRGVKAALAKAGALKQPRGLGPRGVG